MSQHGVEAPLSPQLVNRSYGALSSPNLVLSPARPYLQYYTPTNNGRKARERNGRNTPCGKSLRRVGGDHGCLSVASRRQNILRRAERVQWTSQP